jgi:DNA modification methylase
MKDMPDKSVDLVLTDPPYGISVIGGNKPFGSIGGNNIVKANTYKPIANDNTKVDFADIFRISKNQVIFGGNYFDLPIKKGWIVWDKKKRNDWNDNFSDGELAWTSFDRPLKIFRWLYMGCMQEGKREKRCHPTQKPLELMKWIIENYTSEGDTILDPFMGSGTTGVACKELGRNFIGIEINKKYYKIAEKRIFNTQKSLF